MSEQKEKRKITCGPLDGYIIRCGRSELRAVLNHEKIRLVALYWWDTKRGVYWHQGTMEPEELPKFDPKNSVLINIYAVKYGEMFGPNPTGVPYDVRCWLIEGDKI